MTPLRPSSAYDFELVEESGETLIETWRDGPIPRVGELITLKTGENRGKYKIEKVEHHLTGNVLVHVSEVSASS